MGLDNSVSEFIPTNSTLLVFNVPISGFSEDDMFTYTEDEDSITLQVGADGNAVFVQNPARKGLLTISLMQSSRANDFLSAAFNASRLIKGAAVGPVFFKDGNGTTTIASDTAAIAKLPDAAYARKVGVRQWKILIANPQVFIGGFGA